MYSFIETPKMSDQTTTAIQTQLGAMGGGPFELGVLLPPPDQKMLLRTWDSADLLKSVPWLKAKNLEGAAIYIRPLGEHNLSLIDDLKPEVLPHLKSDGFEPCLVVQTSPNNYQAWLNHGKTLPKELSTAVARALAERFGGDLGSADWRHFGRLGGFTNRKEKHQQPNGLFPFVRIIESAPGVVYRQAPELISQVERALEKEAINTARAKAVSQAIRERRGPSPAAKTIGDFHADGRYGGDLSRADLAYTVYALGHGISESEIRSALTSRDLSKKGGEARTEDYIKRTLSKAVERINRSPTVPRGPNRVRELGR